jgi:nucleolar protein 58
LKQFAKFDSAATALEEVSTLIESKISPMLSGMLDGLKDEKKASLIVADPKLGTFSARLDLPRTKGLR